MINLSGNKFVGVVIQYRVGPLVDRWLVRSLIQLDLPSSVSLGSLPATRASANRMDTMLLSLVRLFFELGYHMYLKFYARRSICARVGSNEYWTVWWKQESRLYLRPECKRFSFSNQWTYISCSLVRCRICARTHHARGS